MKCIYQQKYVYICMCAYSNQSLLSKLHCMYVSTSILLALFTTLMHTQVAVRSCYLGVLQQISSANRLRGPEP